MTLQSLVFVASGNGIARLQTWVENPAGLIFTDIPMTNSFSTNNPFPTTNFFTAPVTGLMGGVNTIGFRATVNYDLYFVEGLYRDSYTHIYYKQMLPLAVDISGKGAVSPNLNRAICEVSKTYQMKAKPAAGYAFAGWTGDTNENSATLTFTMRSNMVVRANFVPTPFTHSVGTYEGTITPLVAGPPQLAGFFKTKITQTGKFMAKVQLGDKIYSLSGTFLADGSYSGSLQRKGLPPVNVRLQLDINALAISGIFTDLSWSSDPTGELFATFK